MISAWTPIISQSGKPRSERVSAGAPCPAGCARGASRAPDRPGAYGFTRGSFRGPWRVCAPIAAPRLNPPIRAGSIAPNHARGGPGIGAPKMRAPRRGSRGAAPRYRGNQYTKRRFRRRLRRGLRQSSAGRPYRARIDSPARPLALIPPADGNPARGRPPCPPSGFREAPKPCVRSCVRSWRFLMCFFVREYAFFLEISHSFRLIT